MRKRAKKAFLSILAATTILTNSGPVLASKITVTMPQLIYESTNKENLSSGVVHEHIQRFTDVGWWNINVIRIDLNNQYTELKGLFNPNGIPNRDTVSNMVQKHDAIAGINGDYFNYQPLPSSLGTLINDGELISSSIEIEWALPTFFVNNSSKASIDYLDNKMVITNIYNGSQAIIDSINKVSTDFSKITLLNKHWGEKSIGNRFHQDLTEVLIVNGQVQDKRKGGEPFTIPTTGDAYVLAVRNNSLDNFNIGDMVDLELTTVPDVEGIKFAIGGGSIILKDGELSLTNINSKGNEPRTGIGINQDKSEVILVTIDGRDSSFKGVSQEMFGAILRELGAYNAINLDGGGSTTMAIKPKGEDKAIVVNKPSDGGQRSVVNAVGVFSNAPIGELSYLKLTTDEAQMFVDTTRTIKVKGYDENYNPIDIDETLVKLSSTGIEGIFEGNKFKATTSGKGKIIAEYNGIIGEMEMEVLGPVVDLVTNTTRINVDTNSQYNLGEFYGKDKYGTKAKIYPEDIVFNVLGGIGEIKDGILYSTEQAVGGAISAYVGNSVENILVSVGSHGRLVDGFETLDAFSFTSYPSIVTGDVTLSDESHEGKYSLSLNYDFSLGENTRAAYANFTPNGEEGLKLPENPQKLGLWVKGDGSGTWLRGNLKDASGKEHVVDFVKTLDSTEWQYVTTDIPKNIAYPVTLQRIYVAETDSLKKPSGSILLDGLTAYYPSPIADINLPTPTVVKDELASKEQVKENGFSFIVAAEPKGLNELVGYDAASTLKSRISKNKIGVLLNGASWDFSKGLTNYALIDTTNAYRISKHMDAIFFNINTAKGGIRATDSSQWTKLLNDLESRNETNFILFLTSPVFGTNGFTDKLEAELLHSKLVEAKEKGKNVFVVYGGNSTSSDLIDGIRYISLNTSQINNKADISNISVVEFVVNGSNISYQIDKVY